MQEAMSFYTQRGIKPAHPPIYEGESKIIRKDDICYAVGYTAGWA
jgi:hypothetical protein